MTSLFLLLAVPFAVSEQQICHRVQGRVVMEPDGGIVELQGHAREVTCGGEAGWNCGGVRKFGVSLPADAADNDTSSQHLWSSLNIGCVHDRDCATILGAPGDNVSVGCKYSAFTWRRWEPRSCNAAATPPYNAVEYTERTKLFYGCCDDANFCLDGDRVSMDSLNNLCTEGPERLSLYLSALHECWHISAERWKAYLYCNENGTDVVADRTDCTNEYGEWDRSRNCTWFPPCRPGMREAVRQFGQCACQKAKIADFPGDSITRLMESVWNNFCPTLELTCNGEGHNLWLRERKRRKRIAISIARTLTAEELRAFLQKLKDRMQCDDEVISVDYDAAANRRRLVGTSFTVNVDSVSDAFIEALEASGVCDSVTVSNDTGETVTVTCSETEVYDELFGNNETVFTTEAGGGDGAVQMGYLFGVIWSLLVVFC